MSMYYEVKVDLASYPGNIGAKLNLILLHAFFFFSIFHRRMKKRYRYRKLPDTVEKA